MRKRSTEIIQEIIRSNKKHTLKDFASTYHVSIKTLRNDMKEINEFLSSVPTSEIEITSGGDLRPLPGFDGRKVKNAIYQMDPYVYKLSTEERHIYIMMMLAIGKRHISMQRFADELCVSRITIVNDMDTIKERFRQLHADLLMDPGKGMILECGLKEKADILIMLYRQIAINNNNEGFFQKMISDRMEIQFSFSDIFSYVQEYLEVCNLIFVEDVLYDIVLYLFVVFNFCRADGLSVSSREKMSGIDHIIIYTGYMLNVTVTDNMMIDFRQYLSDHQLHSFVKSVDEIELYKVIHHFIEELEQGLDFNLEQDTKLMDSLLLHIKNGKDWGNYEVELPDEQAGTIDYELLQKLVDQYSYILEDYLSYELSDNMKKSIVIHICVSIIRNQRKGPRCSVVVVCPGSMATGKYLESQVRNYFDFEIMGTYSASKVVRTLQKKQIDVDFIISTVPIRTSQYDVIEVHPFLTLEDMNLIQKKTFEKRRNTHVSLGFELARIKSVIYNEITDAELADRLCKGVTSIAAEYKKEYMGRKKNAIAELLTKDNIQMTEEVLLWKDAFYVSAKPLLEEGVVNEDYIDRAIENVKEYGDYLIVSKGVVLVHAEKKYGAFKDGLSLLVAKSGVHFQESDEKAYLIFCFSNTGEKKYLNLLRSIINIGRTDGKVHSICAQKTIDEVFEHVVYDK